jgi:hypothetical protein
MFAKPTQLCRCGSELPRYDLTDAAGIFCCYVCEECEAEKKKKYRPEIFEPGSRYALYEGDEEQLEIDYED